MGSKANLLTPIVVKKSTAFIAGHQARRIGSSCSKDPNSSMAFGGAVAKDSVKEGAAGGMTS